ncbi:signal peptidase II [Pseudomonas luteola]|uniref:signal peptidase II n=1 Tax=Pseudomonas luteola TaxID=47886 RepID=UPI00388E0A1B
MGWPALNHITWALLRWKANPTKAIAIYFIALGGASNLLDRLFRDGHLVDYLILNLSSLHTGLFNHVVAGVYTQ